MNGCWTHHWTFLNWVQSHFRESGVPHCEKIVIKPYHLFCYPIKKEEVGFFLVKTHKILNFLSFLVGGTPTSLKWLGTQFKRVQWCDDFSSISSSVSTQLTELDLASEFHAVNWTWIELFELLIQLLEIHQVKEQCEKDPHCAQYYSCSLGWCDLPSYAAVSLCSVLLLFKH